ncbi:MAG: helix-turn-helix domain-containing protein [Deltaproteobacteria bacterium]|nr:helix-turn-helix domain-containing protein [Deltaproteobacteria bacterium]
MPIPTSLVLELLPACRAGGDASLAALARRARRSPFELHRAFLRVTGETPKRFTARMRLERAAVELVRSRRPILDVALDAGFASHEVFSRAFLRRFGMSPRAYRERGLGPSATRKVAARHADVVGAAGPCIGLHHLPTVERTPITMPTVTIARRDLAPATALVIRRKCAVSEIANTLSACLPRVFAWCQQHGVPFAGPPMTRYLAASGPGLVSLEAGLPIAVPSTGDGGDIVAIELPGGPAAVAIHEGNYDTLAATHAAVERWLDAEHLEPNGPPWESYVTDPGTTPDPKDWRTEVVYPLRR